MAHTFEIDEVLTLNVKDNKSYEVTFKGLIAHLFDIVFTRSKKKVTYNISDLPIHLQKDIGIFR
jgi:hypothetical protein